MLSLHARPSAALSGKRTPPQLFRAEKGADKGWLAYKAVKRWGAANVGRCSSAVSSGTPSVPLVPVLPALVSASLTSGTQPP